MAIYTLPNGAEYNTGKDWDKQTDYQEVSDFITEIQTANTFTTSSISGLNPNLPRITSRTWTETSYTGSNYIFRVDFSYHGDTYKSSNVQSTFTIEDK